MNIAIPKIWSIVIIVVATYLIILGIFFFLQSSFVYFPFRDVIAEPKHIGLSFENIVFNASDGIRLSGWYIPCRKSKSESKGVLLFCHGNAGNISHRLDSIQTFNHLGLDVLIFDYRGYGNSQGKPSEKGTYRDAQAAWEYLTKNRNIPEDRIILFGRSLGGSIATWLASKYNPKALIVESCFTSVKDLGSQLYPFLPVRLLSKFDYNTKEYLKSAKCPVLIIHSKDDDIIPFSHGKKLFAAANEPKDFLEISGSHNEGFIISADKYEKKIDSFINEYIK
ncbi:MAG: alpha/beta hydrolase [Endomicrobiales bacterium]|nr:alpha/beta hydrolase [Endomicrobiales bacterium]